jgi:pimeloyl-ACP methyl ester carboxylesterase
MAVNELRGLAEVGVDAVDVTVATPAQEMHEAIAERVFRSVGPVGEPVRVVHDLIAESVWAGLRRAGAAAGAVAGAAAQAAAGGEEVRVLDRSRAGGIARAAVNALFGDRLEERANDVRIEMAVCRNGHDVELRQEPLAEAFPRVTPRIAVFLHGLGEDEHVWKARAGRHGGATYGSRLRADLGYTPVYVRYNTGLHVSENGRRLAALLDGLVGAWPVTAEELVLIGHSMGGLVARSACHEARGSERAWLGALRHVVLLGSPHLGAPLEKLVNVGSWALAIAAESRPLAGILNARSAGIKDLRFGFVCEDDWRGHEPDALLRNTRVELPELDGAAHHYVSATLTQRHDHPVGAAVGDALVRHPSASGRGIASARATARHFGGLDHFDLLNHPEVYAHLRACLSAAPATLRERSQGE